MEGNPLHFISHPQIFDSNTAEGNSQGKDYEGKEPKNQIKYIITLVIDENKIKWASMG